MTERDWLRLVRRYEGKCAYCGTKPDVLHMDHLIPLKRGGRHSIGNVIPSCQPCNSAKGTWIPYAWKVRRLLTQYAKSLEVA